MTVVVVAEKPSVARDIAQVVGAQTRASGWLHGNGYVVTWAIGHLVGLAQPHEINPDWKAWRAGSLPMLPEQWPLAVLDVGRATAQGSSCPWAVDRARRRVSPRRPAP